jgi:hypothetical protein
MKLKLRSPSRRRANAFGSVGAVVGTTIGALPVTARPGKPERSTAVKFAVPAVLVAVVAIVVSRRRRTTEPAPESWATPAPPAPAPEQKATETQTERDKAEATGEDHAGRNGAGVTGGAETTASAEAGAGSSEGS